jgi:hypothetical protein
VCSSVSQSSAPLLLAVRTVPSTSANQLVAVSNNWCSISMPHIYFSGIVLGTRKSYHSISLCVSKSPDKLVLLCNAAVTKHEMVN